MTPGRTHLATSPHFFSALWRVATALAVLDLTSLPTVGSMPPSDDAGGRISFATSTHRLCLRCSENPSMPSRWLVHLWGFYRVSHRGAGVLLCVQPYSCHAPPGCCSRLSRLEPGHSDTNRLPDPLPRPAIHALPEAAAAVFSNIVDHPGDAFTSWLHSSST